MSDVVFILGAGASVEGGGPTMRNFLDIARVLYRTKQAGSAERHFKVVFDAIAELGAAYEKAEIDTDNLESVFSLFEMATLFGKLGNVDVEPLREAMRAVIVTTLERRLPIAQRRSGSKRLYPPPPPYEDFVRIALDRSRRERATFITFNYDVCLDVALHFHGYAIDYGFANRPQTGAVPLLKLHGSMNWTPCQGCGGAAAIRLPEYYERWMRHEPPAPEHHFMFSNKFIEHFDHCNGAIPNNAKTLIVPPTWSKGAHHEQIRPVWQSAARALSDARIIVVIGYSLPGSDEFFRQLYALGTIGSTRLEHFWVIDEDKGVEERFRKLLGATARPRFRLIEKQFGRALQDLEQGLNQYES